MDGMDGSTTSEGIDCINTGDTAWVLISTVLVLGMIPALALFESGLLRSKNSLSIIAQIFGGTVFLAMLYVLCGYSLMFGPDQAGLIGNFKHVLFLGVDSNACSPLVPNIPIGAHAIFMMQFANITPLLMTGAWAERLRWPAFVVITLAWEVIVYYPLAHWIWGGGWMDVMGVQDFAGGIVIHATAGTGAVVICAMFLGRRDGFEKYHGEFPPSNVPLAAMGAALLWIGWNGFNAGSALTSGAVATQTVIATQVAGASCGCVWLILQWAQHKPSSIGLLNGVIAGLAGITPASGYISPQSAIVVGIIIGFGSYYGIELIKGHFKVDDALDVSSVHGIPGIIGALAIGFCGDSRLNPAGADGLFLGGGFRLLGLQTMAVVVAIVWTAVWTWVIVKVTSKFITLRVDDADEDEGLDVVDFQEYAYHDLWLVGHERFPSEDMDARYATLGSLLGVTTNSVSRGVLNGGESAPILGFNR